MGIEWLSNLGVSFHGGRGERIGGYLIHSISNFELIGEDKSSESSRIVYNGGIFPKPYDDFAQSHPAQVKVGLSALESTLTWTYLH